MVNQSRKSTTAPNNIAVAYLRVSTKKQKKTGVSIESQRESVKNYAVNNNLELDEKYIFTEAKPASKIYNDRNDIDDSLSKRPILNHILSLASKGKFNTLIVYSRDRLTRNTEEAFALKYKLKQLNKIDIQYSKPNENFETNENIRHVENLIEIVLTSIAELEADMNSSRTRLGNKYCAQHNLWPGGKIPFGYYAVKVKNHKKSQRTSTKLKCIPFEKEIIKEIFELYTSYGYGYRKIASIYNKKYPFKTWTKSAIESILKNETYTGKIVWGRRGGRRNPGRKDKPIYSDTINENAQIIDQSLFNKSVYLREKKSELKNPKYYSTPFILKDKLYCKKCEEKLLTKNYGKGKNSVYRCPTIIDRKSELIIEKTMLEDHFISQLSKLISIDDINELWHQYIDKKYIRKSNIEKSINDYEEKTNILESQLNDLEDALKTNMNYSLKTELMQLITLTKKKIGHFNQILNSKRKDLYQYHNSKDSFKKSLNNFFKDFQSLNIYNKRMLIDLLVDKIIVDKNEDEIKMDIIINPPKTF
ncbi:MAG: recombinase family protein [Firmicutes bacterium]|nr:recombinase family protein [Bacillota bacterium]